MPWPRTGSGARSQRATLPALPPVGLCLRASPIRKAAATGRHPARHRAGGEDRASPPSPPAPPRRGTSALRAPRLSLMALSCCPLQESPRWRVAGAGAQSQPHTLPGNAGPPGPGGHAGTRRAAAAGSLLPRVAVGRARGGRGHALQPVGGSGAARPNARRAPAAVGVGVGGTRPARQLLGFLLSPATAPTRPGPPVPCPAHTPAYLRG